MNRVNSPAFLGSILTKATTVPEGHPKIDFQNISFLGKHTYSRLDQIQSTLTVAHVGKCATDLCKCFKALGNFVFIKDFLKCLPVNPFSYADALTNLQQRCFDNIEAKADIAHNDQFILLKQLL